MVPSNVLCIDLGVVITSSASVTCATIGDDGIRPSGAEHAVLVDGNFVIVGVIRISIIRIAIHLCSADAVVMVTMLDAFRWTSWSIGIFWGRV